MRNGEQERKKVSTIHYFNYNLQDSLVEVDEVILISGFSKVSLPWYRSPRSVSIDSKKQFSLFFVVWKASRKSNEMNWKVSPVLVDSKKWVEGHSWTGSECETCVLWAHTWCCSLHKNGFARHSRLARVRKEKGNNLLVKTSLITILRLRLLNEFFVASPSSPGIFPLIAHFSGFGLSHPPRTFLSFLCEADGRSWYCVRKFRFHCHARWGWNFVF